MPRWRRNEEPLDILATRVPKSLRLAVRVHCIEARTQMQDFVAEAIRERLVKVAGKARR